MKLDAIDHALLAALQHDARQRRRNHDSFRTWAASLPDVISVFAMAGRDDYLLHLPSPTRTRSTRSWSTASPSETTSPTSTRRSSTNTSVAPRSALSSPQPSADRGGLSREKIRRWCAAG
jgi:hypothetical protein